MHWYTDALSIALFGALAIAVGEVWRAWVEYEAARVTDKRSKWWSFDRKNVKPLTRLLLPAFGSLILLWAAVVSWWP